MRKHGGRKKHGLVMKPNAHADGRGRTKPRETKPAYHPRAVERIVRPYLK
jgi:ribosomal protein S6E (S10)